MDIGGVCVNCVVSYVVLIGVCGVIGGCFVGNVVGDVLF